MNCSSMSQAYTHKYLQCTNMGITVSFQLCNPDINECEIKKQCTDNADCQDTEGSFECTCRSGYTGDGDYNCTGVFYVHNYTEFQP